MHHEAAELSTFASLEEMFAQQALFRQLSVIVHANKPSNRWITVNTLGQVVTEVYCMREK